MRYPKEALVFEVISQNREYAHLPIGMHVECGGPCCLNYGDRHACWSHGVMVLNDVFDEEKNWQSVNNLRPLTAAAREMAKLWSGK